MIDPTAPLPLDWTIETTAVPDRGLKGSRSASEAERTALAEALGIMSCDALEATYQIRALGEGAFRLEGGIDAAVTQACVISLEPIAGRVAEAFSVEFRRDVADQPVEEEAEILAAPDVERLEHDRIALGRIVYEALAAGLDPYPRKDDAAFDWTDPKLVEGAGNPFAVLKKLKE